MTRDQLRTRLEAECLVVGYAMSRLDRQYLRALGCSSWRSAFDVAAQALGVPPASLKNLRDEFDPYCSNPRMGWHRRDLRASRQRVMDELAEVSDEALIELVERIVRRDVESVAEAVDSLVTPVRIARNVAERLLTGRRAEEYFLANCARLVSVQPSLILDCRNAACGFDFGIADAPNLAIEVKGLRDMRGSILFTDCEWTEAGRRGADYSLVVVGNLAHSPIARVIRNPHCVLSPDCYYVRSVSAVWRTSIGVQTK